MRFSFKFGAQIIFKYEVPNWTKPNCITLNWTSMSHTKACITIPSLVNKRENRAD